MTTKVSLYCNKLLFCHNNRQATDTRTHLA